MTHPRVAWNSQRDEYFVVWGAADATTCEPTDVAGVEVSAGGVPGAAAHISSVWDKPSSPDIAFNPGMDPYSVWSNVYYVVWRAADPYHGNNSHAIMGAVGQEAGTQWASVDYLSDRRVRGQSRAGRRSQPVLLLCRLAESRFPVVDRAD